MSTLPQNNMSSGPEGFSPHPHTFTFFLPSGVQASGNPWRKFYPPVPERIPHRLQCLGHHVFFFLGLRASIFLSIFEVWGVSQPSG